MKIEVVNAETEQNAESKPWKNNDWQEQDTDDGSPSHGVATLPLSQDVDICVESGGGMINECKM